MKIELKNIRYAAFASDETLRYEASLYVDGKRIGVVANDGHGGPDHFHGDRAAYYRADEWLAANHPPVELSHGETTPMDIEMYCDRLLDEDVMKKELKRAMKSKVLYYNPAEKRIWQIGWKNTRKIEQRHISHVAEKYPEAVILNVLPFDKALDAYREYAAVA